jgi:hypothetical protein
MKALLAVLVVGGLLLSAVLAEAEDADNSPGSSGNAPGQQEHGQNGPGASGNSPGHQMQNDQSSGTDNGPGASNYAPGQKKKDY